MQIHPALIKKAQWSGSHSTKDGDLVARFIDSTISVNAFCNGKSMP
jgi:hypothetical protein